MTEHGAPGRPGQGRGMDPAGSGTAAPPGPRFSLSAGAVAIALLIGSVVPVSIAAAVDQPAAGGGPAAGMPAQAAAVSAAQAGSHGQDRFVVKFKDRAKLDAGERAGAYRHADRPAGVGVTELRSTATDARVVETGRRLDSAEAARLLASLKARRDVEYAEPDMLMRPALTPNDTHFALQWPLAGGPGGLRATDAWDTSTGAGEVVAVVDTGITKHSDLAANLLPGYDMISDPQAARDGGGRDGDARDEGDWCGTQPSSWHGTHVAGIAAAAGDNARGIAGVAYRAKILPVRAVGACGGSMSDVADAVVWASGGRVDGVPANEHPARVVNISLGGTGLCPKALQSAIDSAHGRGAVVVAAAGNEGSPDGRTAPANCRNVIAVAASGPDGSRARYSNYGSTVDVAAPGGDSAGGPGGIYSTLNSGTTVPAGETYGYLEGTSMAAPHVAGLAALLLAADPALTPGKVEARIKASARPSASCPGCGAGLADAASAVLAAGPASSRPALAASTPAISGTAAVGRTLAAGPGTWTAGTKLTYRWYRSGTAIKNATHRTYRLVAADRKGRITVRVTGSKTGYATVRIYSAATSRVR